MSEVQRLVESALPEPSFDGDQMSVRVSGGVLVFYGTPWDLQKVPGLMRVYPDVPFRSAVNEF